MKKYYVCVGDEVLTQPPEFDHCQFYDAADVDARIAEITENCTQINNANQVRIAELERVIKSVADGLAGDRNASDEDAVEALRAALDGRVTPLSVLRADKERQDAAARTRLSLTHWSKDPLIPYAGCECSSCAEARAVVVGVSDGTAHSDQLRTVWTKSTDSDPYCVHCGTTWDIHLADGHSTCPQQRRAPSERDSRNG